LLILSSIYFSDNVFFASRLFVSEKVTEVIVFGGGGSGDGFFDEFASDLFFEIVFFGMGEADSEEFDQLKLTFDFELFNKFHEEGLELIFDFFIFIFILLVLNNKGIIRGINANGQATILIQISIGGQLLHLLQPVLPHKELFPDQVFKLNMSFLNGDKLIKDRHSMSFHIVNIEIFLTVVGVDGIELEEVLLAVG
jgi:hypothetical protein